MNYFLGFLFAAALIFCLMTFTVPTLIGVAVASGWWLWQGRDRSVH